MMTVVPRARLVEVVAMVIEVVARLVARAFLGESWWLLRC